MVEISNKILLRPFRACASADSKHRALPHAKVFCSFRARTLSVNFAIYDVHLNYLTFNENMQLLPEFSGMLQIPLDGHGQWGNFSRPTISIIPPGYIFVYVANQSLGKDVWFDNIPKINTTLNF